MREELEGLVQVLSRLTANSDEREASDLDNVLTLVISLPFNLTILLRIPQCSHAGPIDFFLISQDWRL